MDVSEKLSKISGVADEMLQPGHTCRGCEFKVCPSLGLFSNRLKSIVNAEGYDEYRSTPDEILVSALRKIMETTSSYEKDLNTMGYVNRIARNALDDIRKGAK